MNLSRSSDQKSTTLGQPIPFRRLVRVGGNPLTQSRGEVAIYLAEQGIPIVPCHWPLRTGDNPVCSCSRLPKTYQTDHSVNKGRIGKHPFGLLAPRWKDNASTDPEMVRGWLAEVPDLNFGIATGRAHMVGDDVLYLVVLDADSPEADDQLRDLIHIRPTLEVVTGRGLHIYQWTDRPMKGSNRLLAVPDVDVKGLGGYVMAPRSLHYTGATYKARGRLEDICTASDDLRAHLMFAEETATRRGKRQRITLGQDNVIGIGTARTELPFDIPDELLALLNQDPDVGRRSEPAFLALRRLAALIEDDLDLAETMLSFPLGVRYYERRHDYLLGEITRARKYPDTPKGQAAHFFAKQQTLVDEQWIASYLVLPTTARKVLRGFQQISLERCGGVFAASLDEIAIAAGVSRGTAIKYRNRLVNEGWLHYAHQAGKGHLASTYYLSVPKADMCEHHPTGMGGSTRMSAFGAGSSGPTPEDRARGEKSAREKSPLVDLSSDSARYAATTTLWEVMPYVTEETTVRELARMTGKSVRQVRRITARLLDLGLIADRQRIQFVPNWREIWDGLPERMGTTGKKEAAERRLARERLARQRLRLLQQGRAILADGCVVMVDTGEIL